VIPRSISASSLEMASQCLARWKASSFDRGQGFSTPPAMLGTTLHATLEQFTDPALLAKQDWDFSVLYELYVKAFNEIWGANFDKEWFEEGADILRKWYSRPDQANELFDVDIISREVKKSFPVPYTDPATGNRETAPCNYIIDRLDKLGDHEYKVVDYKSQRSPLSPDQLKQKIQPRLYALAIQIEYPDAEKIWVEFDFLRYDRVATLFTRDDNKETWSYLKKSLQRIVDTPEKNVPETLNENCRYCIRRITCNTLQNNIRVGGIFAKSIDDLSVLYYQQKGALEAIKANVDDIELQLMQHLAAEDMIEYENDEVSIKVSSRKTRVVDRDIVASIVGPELMKEYGQIRVGDLDKLRADKRLNSAQQSLLSTAVSFKHSDPSVKVTKKL
jgi:hypothetical protein